MRVWREVRQAYGQLWGVAKLRTVWKLAALLLTYRLGEGRVGRAGSGMQ